MRFQGPFVMLKTPPLAARLGRCALAALGRCAKRAKPEEPITL